MLNKNTAAIHIVIQIVIHVVLYVVIYIVMHIDSCQIAFYFILIFNKINRENIFE